MTQPPALRSDVKTVNVQQAAEAIGCTKHTVYLWLQRGRLTGVSSKVGVRVIVPETWPTVRGWKSPSHWRTVNGALPGSEHAAVVQYAQETQTTISQIVREAVRAYLDARRSRDVA